MGISAVFAAVVLAIVLSILGLGFFTVRGILSRSGKVSIAFAAGLIRFSFSADIPADRDDPEVIDASPVEELCEQPAVDMKQPGSISNDRQVERSTVQATATETKPAALEGGGAL